MNDVIARGNVPAHLRIYGSARQNYIKAVAEWISKDGVPFAITLTPNSPREHFVHIKRKLKRLSAELTYAQRGVPRSCDFSRIQHDRPRIVGFEEGQVDSESGAKISHFHGLIGLRSAAEEAFCREFLERYWCDSGNIAGPNKRTFCLENTRQHGGGPIGWLRYAMKADAFVTDKEPIFIG